MHHLKLDNYDSRVISYSTHRNRDRLHVNQVYEVSKNQ